jgi:hypothetical protein
LPLEKQAEMKLANDMKSMYNLKWYTGWRKPVYGNLGGWSL